ncbi:MAG: LysM peptidoglycan-binding domain-containing protein [Actinomycetes bacterium]
MGLSDSSQDAQAIRNVEAMKARAAQEKSDAEAIRNVEAMKARAAQEQADAPPAEPLSAPEVAPAEVPAPVEPELRTHTVRKGDTLSAIGQKYGVKWRDIAALNGIANPDLIHPGQVFRIPNA